MNERTVVEDALDVNDPMISPQAQQQAAAMVADMDSRASKHYTPCGEGRMIWRRWSNERTGRAGSPLIMVHGGGGAWSHWIRNIGPLSERYTIWAPDVPGLGESASPVPMTMEAVCEAVQRGADTLVPEGQIDVMGFSFGGPIATSLAVHLGPRLRNLVLAASRYVRGYKRIYPNLITWKKIEDPLQRLAAHKVNLGRMMMGHAEHIDALAIHIQATNTPRARFFGPKLNPGTKLLECLPHVRPSGRVTGICGREDQGAQGIIDQQDAALKAIHPTGVVHIVDNAGHWVQYEAPERFNQLALEALSH